MPPILDKATQISFPIAAVCALVGAWALWVSNAVIELRHSQEMGDAKASAISNVQENLGCQLDALTHEIVNLRETMIRIQVEQGD